MFSSLPSILLALSLFVAAVAIARWISNILKQPSVLFELLIGIVVGNVGLWLGLPLFELVANLEAVGDLLEEFWNSEQTLKEVVGDHATKDHLSDSLQSILSDPAAPGLISVVHIVWILGHIGVLLLLFHAGLESNVAEMRSVGIGALAVATAGMVCPFALGFAACALFHLEMSVTGHAFLAAILTATSVGISARVFGDLDRLGSPEAKLIMGAAVIDDVFGLIILSVVVGMAETGNLAFWPVAKVLIVAIAFIGCVMLVGERVVSWGARLFERLDFRTCRQYYPLLVMFLLAWIAESIQLAAIIGAFAAGLIICDQQFGRGDDSILAQIAPLERFLAPIFFLMIGMQVQLDSLLDTPTLMLAGVLTVAAISGKLVAGLAASKGHRRWVVGWGMVPRGEVGLVFLGIGRGLGIIDESIFSALVIVVVLTTLITPPALKRALDKTLGVPSP